jgi:predicted pyridoxine 5'-phosphate oxidase superfamily flavin-nucleotide-binding protein
VDSSHFNPDELAAQALAGGGPRGDGIRQSLHQQFRLFFSQLPYLFAGAIDAHGRPLATLLTGPPGFVRSPDATTLHIETLPDPGDPAAEALVPGREIGLLGIDLSTRRRIRANGRIALRDAGGIHITIEQSFGNCPQYIQLRTIAATRAPTAQAAPAPAESLHRLDDAARTAIGTADTFFVASRSRARDADRARDDTRAGDAAAYGADISHRGGRPGFVRVDDERGGNVLTIPDFSGNRYFNTLGNLIAEPRASLLFVDFESGDLLQLQGTAEIDWDPASVQRFPGAERLWRFHLARGWRRRAALPLRWSLAEYAPTTLNTGLWR